MEKERTILEEKWEPIHRGKDKGFSDAADLKEEDATNLPRELTHDFQENYAEE
jgi:hypothetical protein